MISITSKSRYAVVALAELARSGERPVPIKELAERRDIPEQFLEQLFSTLRRAGLLTSHRGMRGGYTLSRPADEITVLEVVQTLDGKIGPEADEAGGIWAEGVGALRKVFGQTTIAEVARREAEEAGSGHVLHLVRRHSHAAVGLSAGVRRGAYREAESDAPAEGRSAGVRRFAGYRSGPVALGFLVATRNAAN